MRETEDLTLRDVGVLIAWHAGYVSRQSAERALGADWIKLDRYWTDLLQAGIAYSKERAAQDRQAAHGRE